jgi:MFS family permease
MLCLAQGCLGACILNDYINFDAQVLSALLTVASIGTIYVAGRIAKRRGRSFRNWAWIAGIVLGPLAIALLFLLPNLHGKNGDPA